jgi:mannobiose 2-epimerase
LRQALYAELTERLLPYWIKNTPDTEHGGFIGAIDGRGRLVPGASKGAVLNTRILWTFSAAARLLQSTPCKHLAHRAYSYVADRFVDPEHGGVFWMLNADGTPKNPKKQVYAQAFALYAFAEHHRATGDPASLEQARRLFRLLERHAHDDVHGGYREAFSRDWGPRSDVSLGGKDMNAPKSMNTTLHVLEAYTNLFRVWPDERVAARLRELIDIFLDHIIHPSTHHLRCFFGPSWAPRSRRISYGHDIEASWLLVEAADVLGQRALQHRASGASVDIAESVLEHGIGPEGGVLNEADGTTVVDADRHWWPQAEAMVGFVNAFQITKDKRFADAASQTWSFVEASILDDTHGEWHFRVSKEGKPYLSDNKVGPWKGPYHTARACFEVLRRTGDGIGRGEGSPAISEGNALPTRSD